MDDKLIIDAKHQENTDAITRVRYVPPAIKLVSTKKSACLYYYSYRGPLKEILSLNATKLKESMQQKSKVCAQKVQ